jgi:assimilatory nitrate reductase catalytic subunit
MMYVLLREGLVDEAFIAERTVGFEEVREAAAAVDLRTVAEWTGVPEEDIELAAKQYGEAPSGMLFTARGVEQHAGGYETVRQLQNVVLAAGKIGKAGCGYGAITGQGNGQGGREHGQKADQLPGYRSIENREHRAYIAEVWGIDEKELPYKGVSAFEMMEKVDREEIRGLFIMGSNPVVSNPHAPVVERALQKCEFMVVADLFMSETARMADLILPTSAYLEDEGTMTNVEGRVTLRSATRKRPGEVKHDWQIICEAADHLGKGDFFRFESAEEIFEELRIASKGGTADYFGVTYERLRNGEDLFWPCTSEEHPGTPRLFEEQFAHEDGKARFSPGTGVYDGPLKQDLLSKRYPLHLATGRVMEHYLTGVQTRRSEALRLRSGEPLLEIHPGTAEQYGITDGAYVHLESAQGSMILRANVSETIRPDTMFVPFHWGDVQCVNRLTPPELDPVCKMPEFKVFAVNIRAAAGSSQEIAVSREA